MKNYEKVLAVLKEANGNTVSLEDLHKKLHGHIVISRISTYIWEIKNKAHFDVRPVTATAMFVPKQIERLGVRGNTVMGYALVVR